MKHVIVAAVAVLSATVGLQVAAHADANFNGCPAGYQRLWVPTLTDEGYTLPSAIDSPTSGLLSHGEPGNGNNWVCAVQLGNRLTHFGLPFYNFIDDNLPASS